MERAFAHGLATHRPQKPWPWADMTAAGRLTVPRLGIERIVLGSGSGQAMAFGPGVLSGGARPNAPGTAVIAAHRDTHFRFLEHVRVGDRIELQSAEGTRRAYRVTGMEVVRGSGFAMPAEAGGPRLALVTCYPFGAVAHGPLRYVVHADALPMQSLR